MVAQTTSKNLFLLLLKLEWNIFGKWKIGFVWITNCLIIWICFPFDVEGCSSVAVM